MIPKSALHNDEAKKELDEIKEIEKKIEVKIEIKKNVDREKLVYERNEYSHSLKNFQTIKTFGRDIYEGEITNKKANEYQTDLLVEAMSFRKNTKPRSQEKKQER